MEEPEIRRKSLQINLKEGEEAGQFVARFSTLNVIDHDGDVTLPGAFKSGTTVPVSAFGHSSWNDALNVGYATIRETAGEAIAEGGFYLDTQHGDNHYKTLKNNLARGITQEWSYGFAVTRQEFGEYEGKSVRFIKEVDVFEVSPVLKGAGKGTATLAMKSGMPLADHLERSHADALDLVRRVESLADLRAKDGRTLNQERKDRIHEIAEAFAELSTRLKAALARPDAEVEAQRLFLEYQRLKSRLYGVNV